LALRRERDDVDDVDDDDGGDDGGGCGDPPTFTMSTVKGFFALPVDKGLESVFGHR
jgi:hypothetical protein